MMVGIAGCISAKAATVVDNVPPIFDTIDEDPTPAALTVVGINSPIKYIAVKVSMNMHDVLPVYMYRIAKHKVVQKFPIKASTTIGQLEG